MATTRQGGGRLSGRTALVTGGTTGIGFAAARAFLEEGARVAITGQDQGRLDAAAAELGAGTVAVRADVRRAGELDALASALSSPTPGSAISPRWRASPRPVGTSSSP